MTFRVGDRVRYVDRYAKRRPCICKKPETSTFDGLVGSVTQSTPYLMVHLEGERLPMRFDERDLDALDVGESSTPNLTGAE